MLEQSNLTKLTFKYKFLKLLTDKVTYIKGISYGVLFQMDLTG